MTAKELYKILNERIPSSLSCDWDNDGVMCCPDGNKEIKRVLVTLDVTSEAVERAVEGKYDLIVSHHPFIFKGLKGISDENHIGSKAISLIAANIPVFSFHTRLDAVCGGVNDALCRILGLLNVSAFGPEGEEMGRIGDLEAPLSLECFAKKVKEILHADGVLVADSGNTVSRVAVLGGEGGDYIKAAIASGADTFLSGRLGYHNMTDAPEMNINLIEAGHFNTEFPVCRVLADIVREADSNITADIFHSNKIKLI